MVWGLASQTPDEVDAVILLKIVEARLKAEALEARLKAAARKPAKRRAA